MRKVLSIVLVLALVLGSTAFTFGAVPSDVSGTKYEDAVNVLMELDVISGYPDGSYKPAGIVTRGEMAKIIICALGLEDYAAGASSFKDMGGHWSDKYVAYAVSLGIINGYPDGTFKPDNTVTYDEAAKMLVAALGYTEEALVGTWPANWVTKAKSLGILDGVKAGSVGANRGDIALMAFQTLPNALGKVDHNGVWQPNVTDPGPPAVYETLLDRLGAEIRVTANPGNAFVLSKGDADSAVANVRDYIGAWVTAYVNGSDEIIAIKELKSVFLTGEFTDLALTKFKADGIEYSVSKAVPAGTVYKNANANFGFTNGSNTNTITAAADVEYTIAAKVSGKTIQDVYSIAVWTLAGGSHAQVTKDDLAQIKAKTPKLLGKEFPLDNNLEIDYSAFSLVGVASLEDIVADNVVYVYAVGTKIAKVEVGTEVVKGEVTRVKGTPPIDAEYTINGKVYEIAAQQKTGFTVGNLAVENEVEVYLDVNGDIYAEELITGQANKYAIALAGDNGSAGITDAKLRLFLPDGTEKVFVVTDGSKVVNDAAKFNWSANVVANQVIKYGLNADGEINAITTITPVRHATDLKITKAAHHAGYKIAGDAFIVLDATIAAAPAVTFTSSEYSTGNLDKLLDDSYTAILYVLNSSEEIVVLVIDGAGTGSDAVYGVLNGVFSDANTDNGAIIMVDGEDVEYSADAAVVAANDKFLYEIVVKTDGDATLDYLDAVADPELLNDNTLKFWNTGIAFENNRIKATTQDSGTNLNALLSQNLVVYVYDGGWTVGSTSDIQATSTIAVYATDADNPGTVTFILVQ